MLNVLFQLSMHDLQKSFFGLLKLYVGVIILLLGVIAIKYLSGIPLGHFSRDPAAVAGIFPLVGLLSNIGILVWCATAAICLFCAAKIENQRTFLLCSGILTSLLMFDDLFMFHDKLFPRYLGIPERVVYGAYGVMFLSYLVVFRAWLARAQVVTLATCLVFFALSITIDFWFENMRWGFFIEDVFKLFGIVTWAAFFITLCSESINEEIQDSLPASAKSPPVTAVDSKVGSPSHIVVTPLA